MPFIDVSNLLTDTYIAGEQFSVYRRTEVVNQYGENLIGVMTYNNIIGQVAPHIPSHLIREPSFTAKDKYIQVITNWPLTGGASIDISQNLYQPDLVYWKTNSYLVKALQDYSQYGAGFYVAQCEIYDWIVDLTKLPPGITNFVITADGQFVITSDGQMVTTSISAVMKDEFGRSAIDIVLRPVYFHELTENPLDGSIAYIVDSAINPLSNYWTPLPSGGGAYKAKLIYDSSISKWRVA
jgi:hypothetical protein